MKPTRAIITTTVLPLVLLACDAVDPTAPAAACAVGLRLCDGECVDLEDDQRHCGGCGIECGDDELCLDGWCDDGCGFGKMACGGSCVALATDPDHCGGCDIECRAEQICTVFRCECPDPLTECGGECVDLASDRDHCGACDHVCHQGVECVERVCADECAYPLVTCGGECVDTTSDIEHCGGCDRPCHEATEICQNSNCACVAPVCELCEVTDIGSSLPQIITGTTQGSLDLYDHSCGLPPNGPARAYRFTAPASGNYLLHARDTWNPHVITELLGPIPLCLGVGCWTGMDGALDFARASFALEAGESAIFVVGGQMQELLDYTLHLSAAPPCPETDLGSAVPIAYSGDTSLAVDALRLGCSEFSDNDATFRFVAPSTEAYYFAARTSSLDPTAIEVREDGCGGSALGCAFQAPVPDAPIVTTVALVAGQEVVVVVDTSPTNPFDLFIDRAPPCPARDLGSSYPQTATGATANPVSLVEPSSCGPGTSGAEVTHSFLAPVAGSYVFDTAGSGVDTVLYVRTGSCTGAEIACNDDYGGNPTSRVTVSLAQGQRAIVVVDSNHPLNQGDYVLNVAGP